MDLSGLFVKNINALGIVLLTSMGSVSVLLVYCPSVSAIKYEIWCEIINIVDGVDHILISGNFNAHSRMWGSEWEDTSGKELTMAASDRDLVPLNDQEPTFLSLPGQSGLNPDLVFFSASLVHLASAVVSDDTYHSDYF